MAGEPLSPALQALLDVLHRLKAWTEEIPPEATKRRFGNPAFKKFHQRLVSESETLLTPVCGTHAAEIAYYLNAAFGSEVRLDYGTGHELSFLVLLCCVRRAEAASADDASALALRIFPAYVDLARAVITTYQLEPAGSRGVWGLDDYSFLPFVFGSAQLLENESRVDPGFVTDDELIRSRRDEYLYVDAIAFIKSVKTGPFHEHSPTLWDISGVPAGWPKINSGMLKMYKAEVLGKFPIMQHLLFGALFSFPDVPHKPFQAPVRAKRGGPGAAMDSSSG